MGSMRLLTVDLFLLDFDVDSFGAKAVDALALAEEENTELLGIILLVDILGEPDINLVGLHKFSTTITASKRAGGVYLGWDVDLALLLDVKDHLLQVLRVEFSFLDDLLEILRESLEVEVLLAETVKILRGNLELILEVLLVLHSFEQLLIRELELGADVLLH